MNKPGSKTTGKAKSGGSRGAGATGAAARDEIALARRAHAVAQRVFLALERELSGPHAVDLSGVGYRAEPLFVPGPAPPPGPAWCGPVEPAGPPAGWRR